MGEGWREDGWERERALAEVSDEVENNNNVDFHAGRNLGKHT